jgi:putative hemolysin
MIVIVLSLVGALVAVFFSGFYSGSETGLYCADRLHLRIDSEHGDRRARRIADIFAHEREALAGMLVGTNVANYVATVCVAFLFARTLDLGPGTTELYTTAIVTPVIFVFGEVLPKTLYQRHADALLRAGSALLSGSMLLFRWPVALITRLTQPVVRWLDPAELSETRDPRLGVVTLLQGAMARTETSDDHLEYVERVFGLSRVRVHQVMVARNHVVGLPESAQRTALMTLARRHQFSRVLVLARNSRRVLGYVSIDELLVDQAWTQVGERARPILRLTPHDSVAAALIALQRGGETLAAVENRHGHLLGLVTLKDLVEELTGELQEW